MRTTLLSSIVCLIAGATSAASAATITEYPLPILSAGAGLSAITAGPDGRLWFTEGFGSRIGAIDTTGNINEYALALGRLPSSIAKGSDGALWFTEQGAGKIGRITTNGLTIQEFDIPGGGQPFSITPGVGGDPDLYFTSLDGTVRSISVSGVFTTFSGYSYPGGLRGIVATAPGVVWVANQTTNSIDRLDFSNLQVIQYTLPNSLGNQPQGMAVGPDGNVWFTEQIGKIGRITPTGKIKEFTIPTADSLPGSITAGPDGNLWFTENNQNRIGQITPNGSITEFSLTQPSRPVGITAGPDGNLWFVELEGNSIGRLNPVGGANGDGPCTVPNVTISNSSWKDFTLTSGASAVWVNAVLTNFGGIPTNAVSSALFSGVLLNVDGVEYSLPDGLIVFDPNASAASTGYRNGRWETTVNPANPTGTQFAFGGAIPVLANLNLANGKKASVRFNLSSNRPGFSISWKFGEAVYNTWPLDWNAALISPTNGVQAAGSPLNTQIQQALNGGGSDYNGKQSSTGSAKCLVP